MMSKNVRFVIHDGPEKVFSSYAEFKQEFNEFRVMLPKYCPDCRCEYIYDCGPRKYCEGCPGKKKPKDFI